MSGGLLAMLLTAASTDAVTFVEAVASVESLPQVVASRQAAGLLGEAASALPWLRENPLLSFDPGLRALSESNRGVELAVGVTQTFPSPARAGRRGRCSTPRPSVDARRRWASPWRRG